MKLLFVYNPQAANGKATILLPKILAFLKQQAFDFDLVQTKYLGHGIDLVREADLSQYDGVIASGGDGTMFEVLNGYYQNTGNNKPPLGILPNGTSNAFCKDIAPKGLSWRSAIDILARGKTRRIDIAQATMAQQSYYFLNIVGAGWVANVVKAAQKYKRLGNSAYLLAVLERLIMLKTYPLQMSIDGRNISTDCTFVAIANCQFTGSDFHIAPKALLDDGLLDIVLLTRISRRKILRLLPSIFNGSHIKYPEIQYFQGKKIQLAFAQPESLAPDGELLGSTPVTIECLKQELDFFWG